VEDRDYTGLLKGPAHVLVGSEPLYPQRPWKVLPSVVDAPERQAMLSNPDVTMTVAEGAGHVIPGSAPALFVQIVRTLLERARLCPEAGS
jgi:pimeloyl-ACP methyl ester carboxylesterase